MITTRWYNYEYSDQNVGIAMTSQTKRTDLTINFDGFDL